MDTPIPQYLDDLHAAAVYPGTLDRELAERMFVYLNHNIGFDTGTLNLCLVEKGYVLPELKCFLYREPDSMGSDYQRISHLDYFGPIMLRYLCTVLHGLDHTTTDELHDHPFYSAHCRQYGIESTLSVAAKLPGHLQTYIIFYLFSAAADHRFERSEIDAFKQAFPYLFNIWLFRLGFICAETLTGRFSLLRMFKTAPRLLQLIKLVVEDPMASSKEYARTLNLSERTVEHSLKKIYDRLEIGGLGKNKKAEVFRRFQFLAA